MSKLNPKLIVALGALLLIPISLPTHAKITAFFSSSADCKGEAESSFTPGGAPVELTLCMTTTEEGVCGHTIKLESENAAGAGKFIIAARKPGANYSDPTLEKIPPQLTIAHPASTHDFGGTRDNVFPAAANQVVATFQLRALPVAKDEAYTIRLGANSLAIVGANGSCLQSSEVPISASATLKRTKTDSRQKQ